MIINSLITSNISCSLLVSIGLQRFPWFPWFQSASIRYFKGWVSGSASIISPIGVPLPTFKTHGKSLESLLVHKSWSGVSSSRSLQLLSTTRKIEINFQIGLAIEHALFPSASSFDVHFSTIDFVSSSSFSSLVRVFPNKIREASHETILEINNLDNTSLNLEALGPADPFRQPGDLCSSAKCFWSILFFIQHAIM